MPGPPRYRTCTAEGAAQEKFWAAREQFCKTLAAEKPDALSKKMRKEMAKVVPKSPIRQQQRIRKSTDFAGNSRKKR